MGKAIITFGVIEVGKHKSYHRKNLILLQDADIKKILVFNMVYSGDKFVNMLVVIEIMTIMTISCNAFKNECLCKTLW